MEIIHRHQSYVIDGTGVESGASSELALSGIDSNVAAVLAIALASGSALGSYDLARLAERLRNENKIDISASADTRSPVRRHYNFGELCARSRDLAAVRDRQLEIDWPEATGEDILAVVRLHGGTALVERDRESGVIVSIAASFTEYDYDELQEVLESLHATGTTPKKIVGDLAQTSITTGGSQEQIISLAEWTISWKKKTVEATTTDDASAETYLGSTTNWTVKSKYMFVDGDQSQIDGVLSAIDGTQLGALPWNFFPTVETGRQAFSGLAIIDGIDIGSGSGKIVGLDVSLRGTGPLRRVTQGNPVANANTATGLSGQV